MGVKSNYFRHSFNAHNDIKIRKLIEECGAKGYAVYFVLLEVYCSKLRDDDEQNIDQEIDLKVLGSYLGVRSDFVHRCILVLSKLNLISNYDETMYELQKSMVKLSIPKSLKYYGKYKIVSDEKIPNKRKEKEKKEKKSKEKESGGGFVELTGPKADDFLNLWNTELVPLGCKHAPLTLSPNAAMDYFKIKKLLEKNSMTVADYVEKIKQCDFLIRKKKGGLNITFALNEDNCFKIISGAYEEPEMSDDEAVAKFHSLLTGGM